MSAVASLKSLSGSGLSSARAEDVASTSAKPSEKRSFRMVQSLGLAARPVGLCVLDAGSAEAVTAGGAADDAAGGGFEEAAGRAETTAALRNGLLNEALALALGAEDALAMGSAARGSGAEIAVEIAGFALATEAVAGAGGLGFAEAVTVGAGEVAN